MPLKYSPWPSVLWGFAALVVLWFIGGVFGKAWNPLKFAQGADGRPSTSKLQWLFWTFVVFFAYVVLYAARAMDGVYEPIAGIPQNVLIAMGLSAATMTAAKGITVSYINSGRITKSPAPPEETSVAQLVTDDDNAPDLSKVQMLAWTALAGAIYLVRTFQLLGQYLTGDTDLSQLPDIDTTLMALMGIGQAAYLGKKAADIDTSASPAVAPVATTAGQPPLVERGAQHPSDLPSSSGAGLISGIADLPSSIAGSVLTPITNALSTIQNTVTAIPGDVSKVGDQVATVVTTLGTGLEKWIGAVGSSASRQVGHWGTDFASLLRQDEAKARKAISTELKRAGTQLQPLLDHIVVIRALDEAFELADRFKMASNSITVLVASVCPKSKNLATLLKDFERLLFGPTVDKTHSAEDVLDDVIKTFVEMNVNVIVNMNPALGIVAGLVPGPGETDSVFQNLFPFWIAPGMLSDWVNGKGVFPLAFTGDAGTAPRLEAEELAFRRELVAAFDRYFRSESADYGALLRATDQRASTEALLDLLGVLCSTTFGFALRCPGMPSPSLPKVSFARVKSVVTHCGDIGSDVAATFSRQIVHPMKSILGVALNGIWVASPNNQALVEAVAGGLGHVVRSLLEHLFNVIFWSVEVRETYEDGSLAADSDTGVGWPAAETYQVAGAPPPPPTHLRYRVYRRAGLLEALPIQTFAAPFTSGPVLRLLQDYAAYRDAVAEYRGFTGTEEADKVAVPTTTFDQAKHTVQVTVTCDWSSLEIPSIPVLRAYCNGTPTVLTCTDQKGTRRNYQGIIAGAAQNDPIWVVSNYGGSAHAG